MDEKQKTQSGSVLNFNNIVLSSVLFFHLGLLSNAYASPEGGQVVGGSGSINQSGLNTTVNQATQNMAIDWQSYNVQQDERVQYIQPNSRSISLNRILGNNASTIRGRIDANGQVILVNPNGIFFSPTSVINVGGIMASGLDIKPSDFMNGNYIFSEVIGTDGFVFNSGIINAAMGNTGTGGNVTLLGKQVKNDGVIVARLGAVNLAAGKAAVVTFDNAGLLGVRVTKEVLQSELGIDPAVLNSGSINAEGGRILLTGSVSQDIFSRAVNTGGMEQATSAVVNADGTFTLGGGADVVNTGTLDVSTNRVNQKAGDIVVIGENVTSSGIIKADSQNGDGGSIELHATDTTLLTEISETTARANASGQGGTIKILGNNVGLFDSAQVNASGANGGGVALIGGDKSGQNKQIRNAEFIYLGENTNVNADAMNNGNGGKLITFANDTTRIYGTLTARGGVNGGNGGFIETSGLQGFEIIQAPDATAAMGLGGEWLIDPYNITIVDSTVGTSEIKVDNPIAGSTKVFDTLGTPATLEAGLITGQLNAGTNVTITTTEATTTPLTPVGLELGNISFDTNLFYTGNNDVTLTLNAANDINIANQQIRSDLNSSSQPRPDKTLNLIFNSGGNVNLTNAQINTNGGSFTATGVNFISTGGQINTVRNNYRVSDNRNSGIKGGNVNITATGVSTVTGIASLDLNTNIITDGGAVSLVASATGGSITTKASINTQTIPFSSNNNNRDTLIAGTNTGTVSMTAGGAISLSNSVLTDGQKVEVINSGSFTSVAGGTIDTRGSSGNAANGDVVINSAGFITIGDQINIDSDGDVATGTIKLASTGAGVNGAVNVNSVIDTRGGNIEVSGVDISVSSTGGEIRTVGNTAGNVLITATGATNLGGNINTQGGNVTVSNSTSFINTGAINTAVNSEANGNVSITSTGTVDVNAAITTNNGAVAVNAGTTYDSGTNGNIVTNNNGGGASGTVSINAQGNVTSVGLINTNNATVNFNNATAITTGGDVAINGNITTTGGDVTVNKSTGYSSTGDIDSGAIAINSIGTITSGGQISSNGGNVDLVSSGGSVTANQINLNNSITSNNGVVTINGGRFNSDGSGTMNSGSGNVAITTVGDITTGAQITATSGNINLVTTSAASGVTLNSGLSTGNDLTINSQGAIAATSAPLLIGGSATFSNTTGNMTLDNNSNSFQSNVALSNTSGNISITDSNNINFATSNIGTGSFTVNATGISQTSGAIIQSLGAGNVTLNSGSGNLVLDNTANEFTAAVAITTTSAASATLNDVSDIQLGTVSTGGDLTLLAGTVATNNGNIVFANTNVGGTLTATAGAGTTSNITQSNAIAVTGNAIFNVEGGRDITLGNVANNFSSGISFNAKPTTGRLRNVTITNANSLNLQTLDLAGNLTVTASGISNLAGSMVVDGNTLLDARGNNIDLTNGTNDFTNVVIADAQNVNIINNTALNIGDGVGSISSISGDLELTTRAGDITQTAALTMGNTTLATFNADAGNINLSTHRDNGSSIGNDFTNIVLNATGNVDVADINGINVGDALSQPITPSTIRGNLTVNANTVTTNNGNITQTADLNMSAGTTARFTAGNGQIILDSNNNNFETIELSSNNAVTVNDNSGITLGTSNASSLTVNAGGDITDSGSIAVSGLTTLAVSGSNDILLNTNSHNLNDVVFTGNNVAINNASGINIGDSTLATTPNSTANGNVTLTAANGNITDIGSTAVNMTNTGSTAELTASSGDINLANTDFAGSVIATAANNITINDATSLTLNTLTAANTIDLTAGENINGGTLTAARVALQARTGINTSTQTATLKADNVEGNVNLSNTGNVTLESLTTSGDIIFNNDANISMAAGSVNADYDVGNLTMTTTTGNFLGLGTGDINNADITAFTATFSGSAGSFGTIARPLVLNVKEQVIITTRQSIAPQITPPGPRLGVTDFSDFQFDFFDVSNAVAAEKLITLEELEDIDPAIFSDVRNYTYGQIAIRLPRDQLFEDELDKAEQK